MKTSLVVLLSLSCSVVFVHCYGTIGFDPLEKLLIRAQWSKDRSSVHTSTPGSFKLDSTTSAYSPVYVGPQDGLKEADKIETLPGQPNGMNFDQYSGYVTVDPSAGRALFYYFVESPQDSSTKPLVLWLNGGPGCSSFGRGAMAELGPFRVKSDGTTLYPNPYAWNNVANIIFLDSPAGVGFSYSNTTSDYDISGDKRTAEDSYTFLVNWLERFPEYKTRDFYLTGESYAGHYVPQLAQTILQNNKNTNQTVINLRGIAIGNAYVDHETRYKGLYDNFWTHALISDEIYEAILTNCNFSSPESVSDVCISYTNKADDSHGNIFIYDIYAPLCSNSSSTPSGPDPCSEDYVGNYLNLPQVQNALHANVTSLPNPWEICNGDTDGIVPTISTRYSINKLGISVKTSWYPWYYQGEVGGYVVEYQNLTFVTIRGAGHYAPFYQPARALAAFSSFLDGKLPPSQ